MAGREHLSQKQAAEYVKDAEANLATNTLAYKKDTAGSDSFVIENRTLRGEGHVNANTKKNRGQTYQGAVGGDD
jgi:hypothetical protein